MARSFEQIYAEVPQSAVGRLLAFRQRYPSQFMEAGGQLYRTWDVFSGGPRDEALVFLPSGLGHGEIWFPYMLELSRTRRCIAFSLAEDEQPDALVRNYLHLLDQMGVQRFVLIAHSIGGLVAQLMAKTAPERVLGMSLIMTGTPSYDLPAAVRNTWLARRKLRLRLRFQNYSPMQKLEMASAMFESVCPEDYREGQRFWLAFIEETYAEHVYKAQHVAVNSALIPNLYDQNRLTPEDFSPNLSVQIIQSSGDQTFTAPEREALLRLFPAAQVEDIGPLGQFSLQIKETQAQEMLLRFVLSVFPA